MATPQRDARDLDIAPAWSHECPGVGSAPASVSAAVLGIRSARILFLLDDNLVGFQAWRGAEDELTLRALLVGLPRYREPHLRRGKSLW